MPGLIEFGLNQFLTGMTVVGVLAVLAGYFVRGFRKERGSVKDETIQELRQLCDVHKQKIDQLTEGLKACKAEHEQCERRVNEITAFNLRLQARGQQYEKTINRLEVRQGLEPTDFSKVTHAAEGSDFG